MKKDQLNKLKSLQNFKSEIKETYILIHSLETQVIATEQLLDFTKAKSSPDYKKFQKYLEIDDKQLKKLFELGFVALFANFECFMFELLKELFKKYPASFQSEKVLKFEDIKNFVNIDEVKDYFIDLVAIEKSYAIETWETLLSQRFKIKVFKSKKDLERIQALNALRNIILHSGSKTNSHFRKEMGQFLKTPVPIGKPFNLDMKKLFEVLHTEFSLLIRNIENT
jgi:hypothetical protein